MCKETMQKAIDHMSTHLSQHGEQPIHTHPAIDPNVVQKLGVEGTAKLAQAVNSINHLVTADCMPLIADERERVCQYFYPLEDSSNN